ncbi:hypothetical protein ACEU6E_05655 [Halorutilales archaeon Cl-col2-1]
MSDIERVVDETREFEDTVVRAVILEVPESEKYPDGYKNTVTLRDSER